MTTVNDGYSKVTSRDTTGLSGGTAGNVNTSQTVLSTAGKGVTAYEWALLAKLDNYSEAGENVALYAQGNKHSSGPTWGACIEACDTTDGDSTGLVGVEVDVWCVGPDNGLRIGVDIAAGDAGHIRDGIKHQADSSVGCRVSASGATPWATWTTGYSATNFTYSGLHLNSKATRAIHLEGEYVVGLDLSTAKTQSAIRLAPAQRMTFEPTDTISWSWLDGRLRVQNGSTNVLEIDTSNGDIYKMGKKVL